ncbi:MAG: hypothetical protein JWN01_523 [Patescibacteria group bacterium]|nr:hypothetical protein [Patescibacteria group bacterium]
MNIEKVKKHPKTTALVMAVALVVAALVNPFATQAATTPSLGAASTYGILANTYTNSAAGTTVNGDVGFLVAPTVEPAPVGGHTNYGTSGPYVTAGANQATALASLNAEACTVNYPGAVVLSGTLAPGVYCGAGAMAVNTTLTLSGSGTYIFRSVGAFDMVAGASIILAGGASACDVFWTPHATTFGAGASFVGTLFDNDAVTSGAGTSILGRILAFNGPVTTATTTINLPSCAPPPATLHVIKQVINNSGGSATASSFAMHVKQAGTDVIGSPAAGAGSPGTPYSLTAGTYVVSENTNVAYAQTFTGDCDASGNITLTAGSDKTCTITNDDRPGSITVVKTIINDNGGTKVVADFPLFVGGTPVTSGATNAFSAPASYAITESTDPNYVQTFSGDCDASGNISLSPGDSQTCTITNNDASPTLHIVKTVINNSGGVATSSNFTMHVKLAGVDVTGSPAAGAASPGTSFSLNAGTYIVSENPNAAYTASFSGGCNSGGSVTLAAGDDKTCTITNTDIAPTLRVIKVVINDNGGTAAVSSAIIHVKTSSVDVAGSPQAGQGAPGTPYTLSANTYTVSEDALAGYSFAFSGDCNSGGSVVLVVGDAKTCTITNNDISATLHVIKVVVNNSGGAATAASFTLHVKLAGTDVGGSPAAGAGSPGTPYSLNAGAYVVSENTNVTYAQSFSGDCDAAGNVSLALAADKTCTITNDDIGLPVPPIISVVKVPSPSSLPLGPGLVTYTFTLHNIGTVTATNITMVDDSCSPAILTAGDTNNNTQLEVSETWTYTCSTVLLATHTNTVTATGLANGLTATDTASATVVVGLPLVSPLIRVTKIPNPQTLPAGGGVVVYTETVTNPGTVALTNVGLTDDKCGPVNLISGDTNGNSQLDITEAWVYTCQANLTKTTTNTATATGEANGLTATDSAIVTVVVATTAPKFPKTGPFQAISR